MPGLNLGAGAQVRSGGGSSGSFQSYPDAGSATAAAFGPGMGEPRSAGVMALAPTNPAGVAFWWSVICVGGVLFMYWSLPA